MSEHTVIAYASDLEEFRNYLQAIYTFEHIAGIELLHIRSWIAALAEKGAGARTLQRKSSTLKSFFHYLLKNNIVRKNPAKMIRTPKPAKRLPVFLEETETPSALSPPEEQDLPEIEAATRALIIELLYQTGIRRAELCNLKESDIETSLKQIRVLGKRNKERLIPVNEGLLEAIKEYINLKRENFDQPSSLLLCLKTGKPVYPNYIYRVVTGYLQQTNLKKKSPHVLRHTFATQLSNNGADLNAIKELLGHSSLAATQIYTHNNIEKLKEQYRKAHPKS